MSNPIMSWRLNGTTVTSDMKVYDYVQKLEKEADAAERAILRNAKPKKSASIWIIFLLGVLLSAMQFFGVTEYIALILQGGCRV